MNNKELLQKIKEANKDFFNPKNIRFYSLSRFYAYKRMAIVNGEKYYVIRYYDGVFRETRYALCDKNTLRLIY